MIPKSGNRFSDKIMSKKTIRGEQSWAASEKLLIPGVDKNLLIKDATRLMPDLSRRRFIASGASLGALTLLTGCDVSDSFFGGEHAEADFKIQ